MVVYSKYKQSTLECGKVLKPVLINIWFPSPDDDD
jgi:hypothetical protein